MAVSDDDTMKGDKLKERTFYSDLLMVGIGLIFALAVGIRHR
jgi:hypothetical protein